MRWKSATSIALAVLLVASSFGLPTVGETAAAGTATGSEIASEQGVSVDVSVEWDAASPDRVRYTYAFDARSDSEFVLTGDERVDAVEGFTRTDAGDWQYDPAAATHRITITQSVSTSADHHEWVYSADSGALVAPPHLAVRWDAGWTVREANPLERDYANVDISYGDHSGFREWKRIYVGDFTTYAAQRDGETYTVYRPALADDEPYKAAVRSLVAAADHTPMSESPASADFVAFPAGEGGSPSVHTYRGSPWTGRAGGVAVGDGIVESDRPVDDYDNTWAHEFVHLQQGYRDGPETEWFGEAQAEYVTATAMHAAGCGDGDLAGFVDARTSTRDDVLADQRTWETATPYQKGLAVLSTVAARLHAQTDGRTTIQDVFRALEDEPVDSHDAFVEGVNGTIADEDQTERTAAFLDRYITTGDYPDRVAHPPIDRDESCLGAYRQVDVAVTTHERGTATTPTPTATATPEPTTSTPQPTKTPTPAQSPDGGDGGGGDGLGGWVDHVVEFAERCEVDGGVSCGA